MNLPEQPQGYYAASAAAPPARPRLNSAVTADVCVVGGGYTGLVAALHLAEAGARVVLLEADSIGFRASGRNGGQIHSGQRQDQEALEKWLGAVHARDLWALSEESKTLVRALVAAHTIDCALKPNLVIAAHDRRALRELEEATEYLARHYNYSAARMMDADETARLLGTRAYPGARMDGGGGHLHPLRYARGLAAAAEKAGAVIYEQSRVLAVEEGRAQTAQGAVTAGWILLACDAYSGVLVPELAPYIAQLESFIVATEPLSAPLYDAVLSCDAAVADTRHVLDYYRKSDDNRLLFAGREAYWSPPKDVARLVRPRMLSVYPNLADVKIDYGWHGTVGITATRMPHFGRLSPRLLFAHGYSGHGVALATLGGKLLAEAALGHPERFETMARVPPREFPGGQALRKPLVTAGLLWLKLLDAI
ncbi:MAG TPA: FAD-binding oxidoreductase [Rhizomicrobium sp.]|jgi:gamma-glutamylputrescine oxidase